MRFAHEQSRRARIKIVHNTHSYPYRHVHPAPLHLWVVDVSDGLYYNLDPDTQSTSGNYIPYRPEESTNIVPFYSSSYGNFLIAWGSKDGLNPQRKEWCKIWSMTEVLELDAFAKLEAKHSKFNVIEDIVRLMIDHEKGTNLLRPSPGRYQAHEAVIGTKAKKLRINAWISCERFVDRSMLKLTLRGDILNPELWTPKQETGISENWLELEDPITLPANNYMQKQTIGNVLKLGNIVQQFIPNLDQHHWLKNSATGDMVKRLRAEMQAVTRLNQGLK